MAASPASLVADLSRPEAFPSPLPETVTHVATHISWVFLTADAAYKVKRPVNLGFVDFTAAAARRRFCEEELRLNRRLAGDVYQGLVAVHLGKSGHNLVGDGEVVDHAVRMRRLPDDRSAANLLRAGRLTEAQLGALAERLAAFYTEVPLAPAYGSPAAVTANVEENLTQLSPFAGDPLDPIRLADVAEAQRRDVERLGPRFAARVAAGRVRDGHGDLRLEHVYFLEPAKSPPIVIDCVEFAERFRAGDVALDVAFFAMELRAAGWPAGAEYFLYRFARASNDFDLYPLLDFYLCYRALVRTKIAALFAHDSSQPGARARAKRAEAERLLALADALARGRPAAKVVIAVGGLVGAGKSTVAEALAQNLGFAVVASDVARKQLAGWPLTRRAGLELYTPTWSSRTYDEVDRRAGLVLASGRSVILDATYRDAELRARARALAASQGAKFLFVEVTCDEATLRQRLRTRAQGPSESDADEAVFDRVARDFVPPRELGPDEVLTVKGEEDLEAIIEAVRARIPTLS
jgi:uncharacterized protein